MKNPLSAKKSSLKISLIFAKILFVLFLVITLFPKASLAWYGFDYDSKSSIDIDEGNLVRPGLVIDYYDRKIDDIKSAKVLYMESAPAGLEMKLKDIFTGEERIVFMDED